MIEFVKMDNPSSGERNGWEIVEQGRWFFFNLTLGWGMGCHKRLKLLRQIWLFTLAQHSTSHFHLVDGRPSNNQASFIINGDHANTTNRTGM